MDMFTREGNIPYTNRNEKPTAATKQPPAASPRGRCMYIRMERERGKGEEGGRRRENVQKGRETAKRVETMEVKTEPESRKIGETVLNHFSLYLSNSVFVARSISA